MNKPLHYQVIAVQSPSSVFPCYQFDTQKMVAKPIEQCHKILQDCRPHLDQGAALLSSKGMLQKLLKEVWSCQVCSEGRATRPGNSCKDLCRILPGVGLLLALCIFSQPACTAMICASPGLWSIRICIVDSPASLLAHELRHVGRRSADAHCYAAFYSMPVDGCCKDCRITMITHLQRSCKTIVSFVG